MNGNDDKLKALLRQWRDIEPKTNFEANVWRRIRLAEQPENRSIIGWLQRLIWQPAFSVVTAIAVAALVGAWSGTRSAPQSTAQEQSELGFLSSGTLAGSYAQLTTRGTR
jgi:anti-sigma factor RsiW